MSAALEERVEAMREQADREAATVAVATADEWGEPEPLIAVPEPVAYPVEALPAGIREAVAEALEFIQAPPALVAASALSAASLAMQPLADVRRAAGLSGPIAMYLLTVAESGERKTSADRMFTAPISEWERAQAEAAKPALSDHRAALDAWSARREGLLSRIRTAQKSGKDTRAAQADLSDLEAIRPEPPRIPRLLRTDSTPEDLAYRLAHEWPSAGVISAEAGIVLGGHAMNPDSIMRHLALLNLLWDGGQMHIGRRTKESFTLRGARLTMGLQIQAAALSTFFERSGELARGIGFMARFLIAWPVSTQGRRPFREAPATWPALNAFHSRIHALLDLPQPLDDAGALAPPTLNMTAEGRALWVRFHDDVEAELAPARELCDIRDVAAKAAENCARLAALFHCWGEGPTGAVGAESVERAARIVTWHLTEAQRFFRGLALPPDLADALRLDAWLLDRGGQGAASTRDLQRLGPVRQRKALDAALELLTDAGHTRIDDSERRRRVLINPALLGDRHGIA